MRADSKKEFHVVSHTHWDREWYQCFEVFRLRLVDLIDHLLEIYEQYPNYVFHLDAQTVCLEDYLEIRPHQRSRLCELIAAGKLLVGPWYVQNDFYLSSGEATVRNLLIGSRIAAEFGFCDRIGYTPDQFGLISQLPQIYSQFGIEFAVFGRGYSFYEKDVGGQYVRCVKNAELDWESADGSVVHAAHLPNWYNNAQRFSDDPARALSYLNHINDLLEPNCSTPQRLLMNGVDHLEAQENLLPILDQLQNELGGRAAIKQSTFAEYTRKVFEGLKGRPEDRIQGELRYGRDLEILQGTLSSRRYLKVLNARCQNLLELELEPLYAGLSRRTEGRVPYPADMLRYLWKELLKNLAHDSICGCSTDRVHQDNENRFLRILDAGEDLKRRGLQALLNRISRKEFEENEFLIAVVNPLPFPRSELVIANVRLPLEDQIAGFELIDPEGRPVAVEIVSSIKQNRMTVSPINLPGQMAVEEMTIRFYAEQIPPSGYAVYRLLPAESQPHVLPAAVSGVAVIENEFLSVKVVESGRVALHCKESGITWESIFSFEDVADQGDSYCFFSGSRPEDMDLSQIRPDITLIEKSELKQSVRLDYRFELPVAFDRSVLKRSVETVENRLVMELSLSKGSPLLDIRGDVGNASKDHRLRLLIHTDVDTDRNLSSQPFDCIERLRYPEQSDLKNDWVQPNNGWVSVRNLHQQFSVLTDGVYDYEHLSDSRHSLALTWVRSTGRITNDSFGLASNGVVPAPGWAAPENQCLRSIPFHIALRPGWVSPAELFKEQQCWASPLLTGFDSANSHRFMGGRPCLQAADLSETFYRDLPLDEVSLPLRDAGPEIGGDVVFSAFKQAEERHGYLLRFFNPSFETKTVSLNATRPFHEMTLAETSDGVSRCEEEGCELEVPPKRIMTVRI